MKAAESSASPLPPDVVTCQSHRLESCWSFTWCSIGAAILLGILPAAAQVSVPASPLNSTSISVWATPLDSGLRWPVPEAFGSRNSVVITASPLLAWKPPSITTLEGGLIAPVEAEPLSSWRVPTLSIRVNPRFVTATPIQVSEYGPAPPASPVPTTVDAAYSSPREWIPPAP